MWSRFGWLIVPTRDIVCLVVGVWGVIHEELGNAPDLGRLGFFGILMVAPGVLAARWLGRGDTPSSPSPPEPSPSSSSSPGSAG